MEERERGGGKGRNFKLEVGNEVRKLTGLGKGHIFRNGREWGEEDLG